MANQFGFSMTEDFLRSYADYLKQLREMNPGKTYKVTLSVDLVPDGVGYEVTGAPQITVKEEEEDREPPDLVAEMYRRIDSPNYKALGEDEPLYVPPEEDEEY